ncbi:hypothetical protein [Aminobacter phage Erebus]|nr:hypothetical protein [Aminobacter phage Erebus]
MRLAIFILGLTLAGCVSTNHEPRIPREVLCGMLTCGKDTQ